MVADLWDGHSPIRQIGLGVSKLIHEEVRQMSLFEDPQTEYYREWDKEYDRRQAGSEDPKLLAYEAGQQVADKH